MTAETAFGQHALYCMTEDLVSTILASAELCRSVEALTTRITSIACIYFVGFFLACEYHLGGVDQNDIVTTVNMGCKTWFVLSTKNFCNLRAETTYHLIGAVDDNPLLVCSFLIQGNCLVT